MSQCRKGAHTVSSVHKGDTVRRMLGSHLQPAPGPVGFGSWLSRMDTEMLKVWPMASPSNLTDQGQW
jgi:hypothetical protein